MGRARGGNALLDHKGGHEVGRAEVPRLSFEAARPKAEVVANGQAHAYLPTYLPTAKPGGTPRHAVEPSVMKCNPVEIRWNEVRPCRNPVNTFWKPAE